MERRNGVYTVREAVHFPLVRLANETTDMHDASFLSETLIFLIAAVIVAPIFQRLRSSLVLGYLVAGVIIGPSVLALISGSKQVHNIAELGVVFLLFTKR